MTQDAWPAVDIDTHERATIERLLHRHLPGVDVWAYGSRVRWNARPQSDLDLVAFAPPEQRGEVLKLREAFEESSLPFSVDLLIWDDLPESFHKNIEAEYVILQSAKEENVNSEWREVTLGEIAQLNDAAYSPQEEWRFVNYLDTGNITENRISEIQHLVAGTDKIPSRARRKVDAGDIVYSTVRPNQRHFGLIRDVPDNFLASTGFAVIRGKEIVACTDFIYWFLAQNHIVEYLHSIAENSTSAYPSIRPGDLEQLILSLPSMPEQRAIAHILGTLDDKIELNRRMNETLEAMARAIYKDWFVDFGPVRAKLEGKEPYLPPALWELFPDRLVDSELGKIPEGWTTTTAEEIATVGGGSTPSTKASEYWDGGTHCWATPKDLSRLATSVLLETERKITDAGLKRIGSGLLPKGSVLLSSRAPIGYLAINEVPVAVNQGFITLVPREQVGNMFLLHWCYAFLDEIISRANGSTFLEISKGNFRKIMLVMPPKPIIDRYQTSVDSIHERVVQNEQESRAIIEQRNTILPKLISGELRVGDRAPSD